MIKQKTCKQCGKSFDVDTSHRGRGNRLMCSETCAWERHRHMWMIRTYGITLTEYNVILQRQNGTCAICPATKGGGAVKSGRYTDWHIDHDHKTGKVRGLLCVKCNVAVGLLDDSPDKARKLALYLEV